MNTCSNCLNLSPLELLSRALLDGLKAELFLTPKPGLVDLSNSGSHQDLSVDLMLRSISLMRSYLDDLCRAINCGAPWSQMVALGQKAEADMLAATGTNCHRGGIFLCGMLLISASRTSAPENPGELKAAVQQTAAEFFRAKTVTPSHGNRVRAEFPKAGIVSEALLGLPALFDVFLPALAEEGINPRYRPFLGMAALMQVVEDSTSLHRCGYEGLQFLKESGAELERTIRCGENPFPLLNAQDIAFKRMNLTMGGVADLIGLGLGYTNFQILLSHLAGDVDSEQTAVPACGYPSRLTA